MSASGEKEDPLSASDALRRLPSASTRSRNALLAVLAKFLFSKFISDSQSLRGMPFDRDAFQRAWAEFHEKVNESHGAIGEKFPNSRAFAAWFRRVLKSRFLDAKRATRHTERYFDDVEPAPGDDQFCDDGHDDKALAVESMPDQFCHETAEWIQRWFDAAGLVDDERHFLILEELSGFKPAAIAPLVGTSLGTVYRVLESARWKLRRTRAPDL